MEEISLDSITLSNPYLRTDTDIEALKKSIETIGLINPLTVNTKNELLAGSRRYEALKELKIQKVMVKKVDINDLSQELISIDENLVRTPLNKLELEKCLNRGREIYETLNPNVKKVNIEAKELTTEEKKQEKELEDADDSSFTAITALKTGLSKSVIKNAIKRDIHSSDTIKKARAMGEVSASQVNEIIKLDKKQQDKILPYLQEKSVKEVRKLVKEAQLKGIEAAIETSEQSIELPRELTQLLSLVKRSNKIFLKIILENIKSQGPEMDQINKQVQKLKNLSSEFLNMGDNSFPIHHHIPNNEGEHPVQ